MADFNFSVDVAAPDYTGVSRGYTSGKEAVAGLFKDVGELGLAAVSIADQNNLQNQKRMIEEGTASILNDFGFRTEGNDSTGTPPELQDYSKQLGKVYKAYTAGVLKESNFQIRIDALSRKVRAQYPGYQAEIDGVISETLNRSTANDLRRTLISEWNAEQEGADADDKKYAQEISDWRDKGLYAEFPDFETRQESGNPYSKAEVRTRMGKRLSLDYAIKAEKDELELQDKKGNLLEKKTIEVAYREASRVADDIIKSGTNATDFGPMLKKVLEKGATDWTDDDIAGITAQYAQLEAKAKTQILTVLQDRTYDKISKEDRDKIVSRALEPLGIVKEALLQKDVGLLNVFKTMANTQADRDIANYLGLGKNASAKAEVARKLKVFESVFGPEAKQWLYQNPDVQDATMSAINSLMLSELADGTPADKIVADVKKSMPDNPIGASTDAFVTNSMKMLTAPTTSPEGKKQIVESFFGEGNSKFLTKFSEKVNSKSGKSDRMLAFEKMMSPAVTQAVVEAAKTDPTLLEKYKASMGQAFGALFKKDIDTISYGRQFSDNLAISFNPETLQFEAKPKALSKTQAVMYKNLLLPSPMNTFGGIYGAIEYWKGSKAKASMDNVNRYITMLTPAMEAVGANPNEALVELFVANGAIGGEMQGSFWSQLGTALEKGIESDKKLSKKMRTGEPSNEGIFDNRETVDTGRKALRDFIGQAEGADYNTMFGGDRVPLTKMTIGEAISMGRYNRKLDPKNRSTAVGKYQIIEETLRRAMKGAGFTEDTLFNEETQDALADWLIDNEAGGGKDAASLASIWASLPKDESGAGVYDGDKLGNKARVSYKDLLSVLQQ